MKNASTARGVAAAALIAAISTASVFAAGIADRADAAPAVTGRGSVVSAKPVAHMTAAEARAYLQADGYAATTATHGVEVYQVVYRTVDARDEPTTASGIVVFPQGEKGTLRIADFEHGTMLDKQDAASVAPDDRDEAVLFAGSGYAAVEPDYLGLGLGPGHHPYLDPASEATASVDMLRAVRIVASRTGRHLDPRVLVAGFSQGAQAAMALGRALQGGADPDLRLAAVAGISGPYDLEHAQVPAAVDGDAGLDPTISSFYFGYWVTAQNRYYHFYDDPAEAFRPPFDTTAEGLFDGTHPDSDVLAAMPAGPQNLFTPQFFQRIAHPTGSILAAMRAADTTCTTWTPRVPVRLFYGTADTQVANLNTFHCAQDLTRRGADVTVTDLGPLDHFPSERAGLPEIVTWFQSIARP